MSITINTLYIAKDSSSDVARIDYEFTTGPRNLLKAFETYLNHIKAIAHTYGNGICCTWIEIDGQYIDEGLLIDVAADDVKRYGKHYSYRQTRTEKARSFIADVREGNL